jgi:hypothetical protein
MKTIQIEDPRNEIVLFHFDGYWEAIGPLKAKKADEAIQWCISNSLPAFICLQDEFIKLGKPADLKAKQYYDTPPNWWFEEEQKISVDEGQLILLKWLAA